MPLANKYAILLDSLNRFLFSALRFISLVRSRIFVQANNIWSVDNPADRLSREAPETYPFVYEFFSNEEFFSTQTMSFTRL